MDSFLRRERSFPDLFDRAAARNEFVDFFIYPHDVHLDPPFDGSDTMSGETLRDPFLGVTHPRLHTESPHGIPVFFEVIFSLAHQNRANNLAIDETPRQTSICVLSFFERRTVNPGFNWYSLNVAPRRDFRSDNRVARKPSCTNSLNREDALYPTKCTSSRFRQKS